MWGKGVGTIKPEVGVEWTGYGEGEGGACKPEVGVEWTGCGEGEGGACKPEVSIEPVEAHGEWGP